MKLLVGLLFAVPLGFQGKWKRTVTRGSH